MDMSESEDGAPEKPRVGESIEETIVNLLDGLIEDNASHEAGGRLSKFFFVEKLLNFVSRLCASDPVVGENGCWLRACQFYRKSRDPTLTNSRERPPFRLTQFLDLHVPQVIVFFSRLCEPSPEETASIYELLEVSWFEGDVTDALSPRLTFFRLAQMERDAHGITRKNSPPGCFNSMEDIIRIEKKLLDNDKVDFMVQCILLTQDIGKREVYPHARTFSQLESFHEEVYRLGKLDDECQRAYVFRLEELFERGPSIPTWYQLKIFLERSTTLVVREETGQPAVGTLFRAEIPIKKIDEALRMILNYLLRCFTESCRTGLHARIRQVRAAVQGLKLLLEKGARLDFREPHDVFHCEQSSLGALIELADLVPMLPLEELLSHVCCALTFEEGELRFDKSRPERLSCLAARSVGSSETPSRVPTEMRPWIRMHRELKLLLTTEWWRMAVLKQRVKSGSTKETFADGTPLSTIKNLTQWRTRFFDLQTLVYDSDDGTNELFRDIFFFNGTSEDDDDDSDHHFVGFLLF